MFHVLKRPLPGGDSHNKKTGLLVVLFRFWYLNVSLFSRVFFSEMVPFSNKIFQATLSGGFFQYFRRARLSPFIGESPPGGSVEDGLLSMPTLWMVTFSLVSCNSNFVSLWSEFAWIKVCQDFIHSLPPHYSNL